MAQRVGSCMGSALWSCGRSGSSARAGLSILQPSQPRNLFPSPLRTTPIASSSHRNRRSYASSSFVAEPVDLAFDVIRTPDQDSRQSLVICHGLFGSKQNWRSLTKAFARQLGIPIYTLDLRNHGHSPHAEPHTYQAMAADVAHFLKQQNLTSGVNLMGHSMGGKVVMAYALNHELNHALEKLIVVDMSPVRGRISPEFAAYTEGMLEVDRGQVKTKAEADKILQKVEPELATRQFLLTNVRGTSPTSPYLKFRIPLDLLSKSIPSIGDFPYDPPPSGPTWDGPTLFLKGEHSRYLNRHNIPVAKSFFPNMEVKVLDAGHWVHAERPRETLELVDEFIKNGAV